MYTFCERSNQSILGEISPEYSLEGRMLKLELQYFGQLMRTADSLEKTLMLGKTEGRRGQQMAGWHHWLNGHEFEQASGVGDRQGSLVCCSPWCHKESDTTEWLNRTEMPGMLSPQKAMWLAPFSFLKISTPLSPYQRGLSLPPYTSQEMSLALSIHLPCYACFIICFWPALCVDLCIYGPSLTARM